MQSTIYLKQIGPIANPSRFFGRIQIGKKFIFKKKTCERKIKKLAMGPICFRYIVDCIHCEIFLFEKCVIQILWPECLAAHFHQISNFNLS